jgi:hypothetical protein
MTARYPEIQPNSDTLQADFKEIHNMVTLFYKGEDDEDLQSKSMMLLPRQIKFTNRRN